MTTVRLVGPDDPIGMKLARRLCERLRAPDSSGAISWTLMLHPPEGGDPLEALLARLRTGAADGAIVPASRLPLVLPCDIALGAARRDADPRYRWATRPGPMRPRPSAGSRMVVCDASASALVRRHQPRVTVVRAGDPSEALAMLRSGACDTVCLPPDALCLQAASGLRLEPADLAPIVPVAGQGATVVLVARAARARLGWLSWLDDPEAAALLRAERTFLRGVACMPASVAAACAVLRGSDVIVTGAVCGRDGGWSVSDEAAGPPRFAVVLARDVADSCVQLALARRPFDAALKRAV